MSVRQRRSLSRLPILGEAEQELRVFHIVLDTLKPFDQVPGVDLPIKDRLRLDIVAAESTHRSFGGSG